ncbi:MAG: hypothetical protein PVH18_05985 [Chloroflexota bacterium]|jgi:hypothetical protein
MNIRLRNSLQITFLALGLLFLVACGTLQVGMDQEPEETVPVIATATEEPVIPAATTETAPSPTDSPQDSAEATATEPPQSAAAPSALWSIYRDPDSGLGYAYPCHWIHQGRTLVSYDEAFFMERSIKGQWANGERPEGALKLEIAAFDYASQNVAPGTPLEEAVPMLISGDFESSEMVVLGRRDALRVQLPGTIDPSDTTNEMYFFQMSPESILLFSVTPRNALTSADVQGIIDSLVLSDGEPITVPTEDPQGALEGREIYADEAAGYCFQYPSDYTLEAYPPSGIPYAGDIVTLKLDRPFYTLGLTATALPVGEQSSLDELVSQFIQGLPAGADAQVERNPAMRLGGVEFKIGGEPAEFLENVPGTEGSRDIFAKNGDRLYRLSFIPSVRVNPQAESDLESLFLVVTTSYSFLPQGEQPQ